MKKIKILLMKKGIFCISFDLELLWGRHDRNYLPFLKRAKKERKIIDKLLDLLDKYNVAATWAVVGHLFLSSCSLKNRLKHPEITRPKYPWLTKDWFESDPTTNLKINPEWYGEDIIKTLKKRPKQEIGSHSFSHVIFGSPGCSKECAETEIETCVELAKKRGIRLESFIFPRNSVGHLEILKHNGFKAFRGPDPYCFKNKTLSQLFMLLDLFSLTPVRVSEVKNQEGLVNIPGCMYFVSARGIRKYIPEGLRADRARRGIDLAIKRRSVFHLWTHPTDFTDKTDSQFRDFKEILKYAAKQRRKGFLDIKSMGEIARESHD